MALFVNYGGNGNTGIEYKAEPNLTNVTSRQLSFGTCPSDEASTLSFFDMLC